MTLKYFSLSASYESNKRTYKELCLIHHPDKATGNLEIMQEINAEWEKVEKSYNTSQKIEALPGIFVNEELFSLMVEITKEFIRRHYAKK